MNPRGQTTMRSTGTEMKTFKARLLLVLALALPAGAPTAAGAAGPALALDRSPHDVQDMASLQAGARNFVNYCLNCHAMSLVRYNRLRDIGLTEEQIRDNLLFTADKVGETMNVAMPKKEAKEWFGAAPPDLSVTARARGADWIYTYLRTFYRDPATATGWNNLVFERVGMPHVLWELSGQGALDVKEFKAAGEAEAARLQTKSFAKVEEAGEGAGKRWQLKTVVAGTQGALGPAKYDEFVRDTVNFMVWAAEPVQTERKRLGIVVLFFLSILILLSWMLKKEFWKDVR